MSLDDVEWSPTETHEASPEELARLHAEREQLEEAATIRCADPARRGQLEVKLEEYILRAQTKVRPAVVRDAICKMAITDILLNSEDGSVEYFDALDYAEYGIDKYGQDLLVPTHQEEYDLALEFQKAFDTIRSYVETGNINVTGGNQLPE